MARNNAAIFDKGIKKFQRAQRVQMMDALETTGCKLLSLAVAQADFHNLTGNTLTSYMAGIYEGTKLAKAISVMSVEPLVSPTTTKLSGGTGWTKEFNDYDTGRTVVVRRENLLQTDEDYGSNTSLRFLQAYRPPRNYGYSLVICTGTEYSAYMENVRNLNVLTNSLPYVGKYFLSSLKPIK